MRNNSSKYVSYNVIVISENANGKRLQQDHPCVIELIRRHYLHKPASRHTRPNLNYPHLDSSTGDSRAILKLLRNMVGTV